MLSKNIEEMADLPLPDSFAGVCGGWGLLRHEAKRGGRDYHVRWILRQRRLRRAVAAGGVRLNEFRMQYYFVSVIL